MPPFYHEQYQDQYPNQYPYGNPYNEQYEQYQYGNPPPRTQPIPPFSQVQVNIPPRQQAPQQPLPQQQQQQQAAYNYHQNFQPSYVQPAAHPQYQYQHQLQLQQQPSYHPQYQQSSPTQSLVPPQQYFQPMPQYTTPSRQIQVNIPKPQPQPHSQPQSQRVLKDVQPTAPRQQQPPPSKPSTPKKDVEPPEPDYETLLLCLADEYLDAAQKMSVRSEDYFKLTATALGCLDSVLNSFKLSPLREAQVSLKYTQLLFNETENYDDAERLLTKTIDLCERLKYHDLKYAAQLLLTRVLYQSRPKAALKDLQGMVQDIEAYKHTAWEYAFRLQYVMFAVSSNQANDNHVAIAQLDRIGHVARQNADHAMLAFAAILEALVYLQATGTDSVQSSQRALAKARALQLNPDIEENPQICLMMEFVDLCGQIKNSDTVQGEQKRKNMQAVLYPALQKPSWRNDGLLYIPISRSSLRGLQVQDSGLVVERGGKHYLAFSWLTKDEVEDLGYLLSGISALHKNAGDGGKAEKFFDEGLSMIKDVIGEKRPTNSVGVAMSDRLRLVQCHFLLEMAFLQCSKGRWEKAQATAKMIRSVADKLEGPYPAEMKCLTDYVTGIIHQGQGDLEAALNVFQSPTLSIASQLDSQAMARPSSQLHRREDTIRNISILSAINTIFILQQPGHPQHQRLSSLLGIVDPLASQHPNKNIQSAWNFVLASLPNNSILKTKQYLGNALSAAQSINNAQITTLCLVTMQEKFFQGVVGEQALKCARAASHQARRLNEPMWVATASGLEAECFGLHGMVEDSMRKREETEKLMRVLPERVKNQTIG